eukprot:gnl/Spiro4/2361_TR1138_c0_g1_i1.p1 gnl/Spiro4/2361_TR1138_c0_g1~~gnl/Spiro4/2361_TR1138_c0_g1_i1.p1  ORF type:complete len:422 (+),score=-43.11 gnl/Spiro4/2361_TR1138_c0_g1_i1:69-1334(+)
MDTFAYDHGLPCRNPNCRSHGRPHPNCKCYSGGGEDQGHLAHGGQVHFCATGMPHKQGCIYYADGGETIAPVRAPQIAPPEDPNIALGHSAVEHGLLGLLQDVGRPNLSNPEGHKKTFEKAKEHLEKGNHGKAADVLHGTPLVGSMGRGHVKDSLSRLHGPIMAQQDDAEGMRAAHDYLNSAIKGHNSVKTHMDSLLGRKDKHPIEADEDGRVVLKKHLEELNETPENLLDIGGKLGHYMPDHAPVLAATSATAVDYLNSIKPKSSQMSPLDQVMKPSKLAESSYDRQLDIAQKPLMILQHVKDGTIIPQDITTLSTIYPGLYKTLQTKASEALINAKDKDIEIPYRQKMGLSALLGQPLESTQSPLIMQSIMKIQGAQQAENQTKQPKNKKATQVELNQINKTDELYATPLQAREMDRKS